ncbi:hypothetical protein [Paenibacillus nasutitermitis]|uniref:Uncharacterized protein n=1 Tax=Paenibacillus nasutitermitis TaxID=1652958 RepID=A0A916YV73_9BACL|nr:hypothetical protein [Paenibacillus nasutitermitis]GGD62745.1 hypothetical protein GCM10010911_20630 [Paenibacillus nasutitermitis]
MHIRKNAFIFILVFVPLMTTLLGCFNNSSQSNDANNNEILGLTKEIRKITSSQLAQITKDMTYREMINTLGNTKDIGSGIKIFRYEYENGQFLDINIYEHNLDVRIREEVYKHIQNMLNNKKP